MEANKNKIKIILISLIMFTVITGIVLCTIKPQMHKQFNFNVIEYFLKINPDGSMTSTKQITTMEVKEK